jgi:ATP-dependent DNA helicase DinG
MENSRGVASPPVRLPEAPALVAGLSEAIWLHPAGEMEWLSPGEAAQRVTSGVMPLVCHAKATARRLGIAPFAAFDVLELFAFVRPARFCVPTVRGLSQALLLNPPETAEQEAVSLLRLSWALLAELGAAADNQARRMASAMAAAGWPWAATVGDVVGKPPPAPGRDPAGAFRIWPYLQEWQERPPARTPGSQPVEPAEAGTRLIRVLGAGAEPRPDQLQYAFDVTAAFAPRERPGETRAVLAEAGTGIGKTLGYIAPSSVWAEKNHAPVWISTYTRNLQRQIDRELDRLYPDPSIKSRKVVVRKGRENSLCLLNLEEALAAAPLASPRAATALGLVARWAMATRDGDMVGGDFPGWLADLLGRGLTLDLTDTRGDCIHSACRHYRKCFIEKAIRQARQAEIVVANHALVMAQAAIGGGEDHNLPVRYVFDEGHHLFDAADAAFSMHFTGREAADLRAWLVGADDRGRHRRRGLRMRLGEIAAADEKVAAAVDEVLAAARILPGPGWRRRLDSAAPRGAAESLFFLVQQQVRARDPGSAAAYDLQCVLQPPIAGLLAAAERLAGQLSAILRPLGCLRRFVVDRLDRDAADLDTASRLRIEALVRTLDRRALAPLAAWQSMLAAFGSETPREFVDWLGIERINGEDADVGLHRHWIDPMRPFVAAIEGAAHGMLITSATLRDCTGDETTDWSAAEARTGARHLKAPPTLSAIASPFNHARQTRVLIVTDVNRDDEIQVAAAYRELFAAAGGGGLGLFTAIGRLRAVHARIALPLDRMGLKLLAQHVDALDVGTLIDIFRSEEDSCLLGTDAVRDGIDVPGWSLRLIVLDRVPWPRPDILHQARREWFGGRVFDDAQTRLRLKQAYGRLVRRAEDRGVFVLLDRALPSRLLGAFPEGVEIRRLGLADAVAVTRAFLAR